jgi:hypothetical protein
MILLAQLRSVPSSIFPYRTALLCLRQIHFVPYSLASLWCIATLYDPDSLRMMQRCLICSGASNR